MTRKHRIIVGAVLVAAFFIALAAPAYAAVADDASYNYYNSGWRFYSYVRLNDVRTTSNAPVWHSQAWSRSYKYYAPEKTYYAASIDKIYAWAKVEAQGFSPKTASQTLTNSKQAFADAYLTYPHGGLYQASSVHRYWEGSLYHYKSLATHWVQVLP